MIRTALFWTHLAAGVVAGAIILLMSVTGVLLTYEKQMLNWADTRQLHAINAPTSSRLSVDSLIALGTAAKAGKAPTAITLRAEPGTAALLAFGQAGVLYLDPATGATLGNGSTATRAFFRSVTNWHRWLAGEGPNREKGKAITGAANLAFLVLVLSGMVLWLPKTLRWIQLRSVLWFRSGLSAKARDFNWHNVLGIWSALPLIAIVASATVIGYPWASDLVYAVVGETPPPRQAGGPPGEAAARGAAPGAGAASNAPQTGRSAVAGTTPAANPDAAPAPLAPSLGSLTTTALALMPEWRAVTVQLPTPGAPTASITLDRGTGGQPQHRATVQLATATGAVTRFQPFDSLSTGRQLRSILRFAHTGEVLGLTGQTIAGLVSLASVILVYTGIALALRRAARAWSRRRQRATASGTAVGTAEA